MLPEGVLSVTVSTALKAFGLKTMSTNPEPGSVDPPVTHHSGAVDDRHGATAAPFTPSIDSVTAMPPSFASTDTAWREPESSLAGVKWNTLPGSTVT